MAYLLDSDTCIWVMREREPVRSRVLRISPIDLAIASMTLAELYWGTYKYADRTLSEARIQALLSVPIEVIPFDGDAARWHADLRYALRHQPIGDRDLVIASVAMANNLTIVTGNVREFSRVPGLKVENWTD